MPKTKQETLFDILRSKPNGKFLIFSRVDSSLYQLTHALAEANIRHAELKGSTAVMMKTLERFRNGELPVILLNTYYAGSGIDISCATDVIMLHDMAMDGIQAIGRAQRVGRTTPLHVHKLCFPSEMVHNQAQSPAPTNRA